MPNGGVGGPAGRVPGTGSAQPIKRGGMIALVLTFAARNRALVVLALQKGGIKYLGVGRPIKWVAGPV